MEHNFGMLLLDFIPEFKSGNDIIRLFFIFIQSRFLRHEHHHHRDEVVSNDTRDDSDYPSRESFGKVVSVTYSSHRDEDAPHTVPDVLPVLVLRVVFFVLPPVQFVSSKAKSETDASRNEDDEEDEKRVFLLESFKGKFSVSFANELVTDVFRRSRSPFSQMLE